MRPRHLYLALCLLGVALPYGQLVPFIAAHGLDPAEFWRQLVATRVGAFFALDVVVSAIALWVFLAVEGGREKVRRLWLPVAATLLVGVSLGLPLFLYQRERALGR